MSFAISTVPQYTGTKRKTPSSEQVAPPPAKKIANDMLNAELARKLTQIMANLNIPVLEHTQDQKEKMKNISPEKIATIQLVLEKPSHVSFKTARILAGLTQKEVALRVGIKETIYSKIELGKKELTYEEVNNLTKAFFP
jgi:DNA-binding XRE family transcriptional regulator